MFERLRDVVKKFRLRWASSFLYFNFLHDSIHYFCANCNKFCKKFRLRRAFGTLIFQFRKFLAPSDLFLPTPLLETAQYMPTRTPHGDIKKFLHPLVGKTKN